MGLEVIVPSVTDTDDMVNVAQGKLQKLVGENASCVRKAKQAMIREDSPQPHRSRM